MSTVSSSYDAVVLGVSQQVPSKRLSGQHWTQDNFISDPVRGLRRRPGARQLSQTLVAGDAADIGQNFRNFDVLADDRYVGLLCRRPRTSGSSAPVYAFQRGAYGATADGALIPTQITTAANTLLADGVNSVAAVGDFFVFAHTKPVGSTRTEYYDSVTNRRQAVVAVKQGTYSRQYVVRVKRVGAAEVVGSFTVPALYNGDGSINAAAAAAAQPNNIAFQLFSSLETSPEYSLNWLSGVRGSSILITSQFSDIEYISATDNGDNTQITAAWREVSDAADLPAQGYHHHVVRVKPKNQDEAYYLRAEADDGINGKVTWKEWTAAGVSLVTPFCIGRIYNGTLYIGSSPADLQAALTTAGSTEVVPTIASREAGDDDSMPTPHFVGREITELRVFQERLLVCSGPVVNASRTASFFNFWRTTVLTYPDDDAVELYATGSEADTIRSSVVFDRSVVFFGDQQQYAISGKVPLTGATATIMQSSAHRDASGVRAVALGDALFYIKAGRRYVSAHQIVVGNVEDTSNSSEVSKFLHDYLKGSGIEAIGLSMPEHLLVRTSTPNTVFAYAFMDDQGRRVFDSWSRWTFDANCGTLAGLSTFKDSPRFVFARADIAGAVLLLGELDLTDTTNELPHLDLWHYDGDFPGNVNEQVVFTGAAAPERAWFGRTDGNTVALIAEFGDDDEIVRGFPIPAVVRPTSPTLKDTEGRPLAAGTLIVTSVQIDVADSGGMNVTTELPWTTQPGLAWNGRILGQGGNLVGRRTLRKDSPQVLVGQDAESYVLRIESVDWHPLTITGLHWKGQYFKRSRSV